MLPRRWILLVLAVAAVGVVLAIPASGQTEAKGTAGDSKCLSCHAAEGMEHVRIGVPVIQQVPRGQEFNLTFSIVVPWKHHLEKNAFSLNLSRAPGISFVGGEAPVVTEETGVLALGETGAHTFTTTANTTEIHVAATFGPDSLPAERRFLRLTGPGGRPFNSTDATQAGWNGGDRTHVVRLTGEDLILGGVGEWTAEVVRRLGTPAALPTLPGGAASAGYVLTSGVYGNVTGVNEIYLQGPPRLNERDTADFTFRLKAAPDAQNAVILYKLRTYAIADVPEDHPEGHPADMQDIGLWVEWATTPQFTAGDTLVVSSAAIPDVPSTGNFGLMRSWGYAIGYASTFLMVPALVLGGTFGRTSVLWLNKLSLGARRRVLWHNASSFGLLAFALLHMALFLLEPAKAWTIGALWGGAAIACLILLGVTGALQQSFVAKWGFPTWRYMHFGIAILMVAFILLHLGLDGTNFKFVRDAIGA